MPTTVAGRLEVLKRSLRKTHYKAAMLKHDILRGTSGAPLENLALLKQALVELKVAMEAVLLDLHDLDLENKNAEDKQ